MRQFVQTLPVAAEFAIVVLGAFGLAFFTTFLALVTSSGAGDAGSTGWYTGEHLFSIIAFEVPIGVLLSAFLGVRGWSLKRLGIRITAGETLVGFGVAFIALLAVYATMFAVAVAAPA